MENMNLNINGIRPAEEYDKEQQARLKLPISEEEYKQLKEDLGIAQKEREARRKAIREGSHEYVDMSLSPKPNDDLSLKYISDMPFTV